MRTFLFLAVAVQSVFCGGISQYAVQMPFLNPAGVTYINGPAPAGLAAGPLQYAAPVAAPLQYAAPVAAHAPVAYAPQAYAPQAYSQAFGRQAYGYQQFAHPAPLAYAAPAYAHAKIPTVHAVPTVHHVQGVADVPYTRVVATPGVVQKQVDVANPAVSTRKFQVRRPAIQKQFFDIEERVVVRNAGSALLELDEPLSKTQQGPAVIKPVHAIHPVLHYPQVPVPVVPAVAPAFVQQPVFGQPIVVPDQQYAPAPAAPAAPAAPVEQEQNPAPAQGPTGPGAEVANDDDSVVVENTDFTARSAQPQQAAAPAPAPAPVQNAAQQRFQIMSQQLEAAQEVLTARQNQLAQEIQQEMQYQARQQQSLQQEREQQQQAQARQQPAQEQQQPQQQEQQQNQQQEQQQQDQPQEQQPQQEARQEAPAQTQARFVPQPQRPAFRRAGPVPQVDIRSNGAPFDLIPQARAGPSVVPSVRNGPEVNQANQQRFIQLLTAQGGVAEVGFGRSGAAGAPVGDAGNVRGRVLSATPAPEYERNAPAGERVSTRRVVVSRPIETLQEFDVVEPVTKLHRITVNQPTVFKSLQHEVARVPTSYPVYGKTLHHSYAHAAVPLNYYQH